MFCVVTILWNFQRMGLSHWDEYYFMETAAWNMNAPFGFFQAYEPPLFPLLLTIMFGVFGIQDYVAIATSEIAALFLCALTFWWTRRQCDFPTAIVSVLILASTSIFVYYAKMALTDMTYTLFFSATIFTYYDAIEKKSSSAFLIAGTLLACTIGTKYTGFQPLLVILIFIPIARLSTLRGKISLKKSFTYLRELSTDLLRLWWSVAPVSVLLIVLLLYLAAPFPLLAGRGTLTGSLIQNLSQGLNYLAFTIYPLKAAEFSFPLSININFYGDVIAEFVGVLVVVLATIGAVSGLVRRQTSTVLLLIWAALVFVFFASLPGRLPRVILPMIVPLSILTGKGVLSSASAFTRLLNAFTLTKFRKRRLSALIRVSFVLLIVLVHLTASVPAITNVHSGYRDAAEFIANNLSNRIVFYRTQPVLLVYLDTFRARSLMVNAILLLNQSSAVVVDFIAEVSPDYAQIQARVTQMTLAVSISNDVPTLNMLDSTPFSTFRQLDPDRTSIRIYIQSPVSIATSPTQSYSFAQRPTEPALFEASTVLRSNSDVGSVREQFDRHAEHTYPSSPITRP